MKECWYNHICKYLNKKECNETCLRFIEFNSLINQSEIPVQFNGPVVLTPDKCDTDTFERLQKLSTIMDQFVADGKNLFIHSINVGNGKTSWAVKLMLNYFDKVWAGNGMQARGLFIHTPTFLQKLKENIEAKNLDLPFLRKRIAEVDLVVWDEVVLNTFSNYDMQYILGYIEARINSKKANIFTANGNDKQLEYLMGDRIYSRVFKAADRVYFGGKDKRKVQ